MRVELDGGWDSAAAVVDGVWLERTARRPDVEPWLRTETRLLPWLGPRLPLPVPRPEVVGENPLVVRHRMLPGEPISADPEPGLGTALGGFLRALHATPADGAVALGVPGPERTRPMRAASIHRFRTVVVPMLDPDVRPGATALCDRMAVAPIAGVLHGDLGPDHVLVDDGRISGIIDWSDTRVGDPAKDLAWALHTAPRAFADAVAAAYGPTADEVLRARDWLRIGPFYAVTHGLDTADDTLVTDSLRDLTGSLTESAEL
ncbi:phosphotransferase [Pseudonocardia sediminis]|nr:phosphotransferase [Pseudonocardia sediminis]